MFFFKGNPQGWYTLGWSHTRNLRHTVKIRQVNTTVTSPQTYGDSTEFHSKN